MLRLTTLFGSAVLFALGTALPSLTTVTADDDCGTPSSLLKRVEKLESELDALQTHLRRLHTAPRVEILQLTPWPADLLHENIFVKNHSSERIIFDNDMWFFANSAGKKYVPPLEIPPFEPASIAVIGIDDFLSNQGDTIRLMFRDEEVHACSYPAVPQGPAVPCQGHVNASRAATRAALICVDFSLFPDDTPLPGNFSLGGFVFQDKASPSGLFVNETNGRKGLQFSPQGVEVTLPSPVATVDLEVGAFGRIEVAAVDSSGATVRKQTVPGSDAFVKLKLSAPDIASLVVTGGNNEGMLAEVCVTLSTH